MVSDTNKRTVHRKDKSDESLATELNLKTLISIKETGLYGNRRTRLPQHRDAMGT